jgi:hypothetical protein
MIWLALGVGLVAPSVADESEVGYSTILALQSDERRERRRAMRALIDVGDRSLVPGLVDAMFFTPTARREEIVDVLRALTGADPGPRYYDWVEWLGARADIEPRPGYPEFKLALLARVDGRYREVLYPGAPTRIRLEEVVWGGVKLGGIPALVNPATLAAAEASYLREDELVFGAWVNGASRAYPLRIMDWHELLNDELGGEPVALSYCTLCRSGILFHTRAPDGGAHVFGTSGLLYRSNKLMIDQRSLSLWSNLTGEPVVGRLARSPIRLPVLPMTLTRWGEWRRRHPETTALDLDPLRRSFGFDYTPGAADRARSGVSFPVWQRDDRFAPKTEVYALRIAGSAKAYAVDAVLAAGVVNDAVGETAVVLVSDPESGAIRAYVRGGRSFHRAPDGRLLDGRGQSWSAEEEALLAIDGDELDARLERQPGHVAFWFGWYGFFPDTEVWDE